MRDRLIELSKKAHSEWLKKEYDHETDKSLGEYVADHLLAGGVIVPLVKVGDKLYALSVSKTKIYLLTITHFVVCKNETQIWAVGAPYTSGSTYICNADNLGNSKWVYLTQEEAEKALKERSENGKS